MNLEFLTQFCDPESQAEYKNGPFINGDYVVATDAHIVAIVNKAIVDNYSTLKELARDYVKYLEDCRVGNTFTTYNITLDQLDKAIKQVEVDTNGHHVCDDCNGEGVVEYEYNSVHGMSYTTTDECPVCHGTGISNDYKYLRSRKGWYCYRDTVIDIDGIYFAPHYIENVISTMKECGVEECVLESYGINKVNFFIINNDVKVAVMPVFHSDDISNFIEVELKANNDNDEAERAEYERLKKKFENK